MNSKMKTILQVSPLSNFQSIAFLVLRLVVGIAMILHGYGKIQNPFAWMPADSPVPGFFQFLAALSEFGGGFALVIGLLSRVASSGIAVTMAVAAAMHAFVMNDPFVSNGSGGSYELPLTYFAVALLIMIAGPGKYSVDAKVFGQG